MKIVRLTPDNIIFAFLFLLNNNLNNLNNNNKNIVL